MYMAPMISSRAVKQKDSSSIIPIQSLPAGRSACIVEFLGRPELVQRLEEFGLRKGICVEMFRQGNPCILRLGSGKVCLRTDGSLRVLVEPLG